jgi:hypothetical protein
MNLRPDETEVVGKWIFDGKGAHADDTAIRIEHLTKHVLQKLAVSRTLGAWETLFRDPQDGRLWERTYPEGEMHGGGPPKLATISETKARANYDFT